MQGCLGGDGGAMLTGLNPDMLFHNSGMQADPHKRRDSAPLVLLGRFMREDRTEHSCRVKELTTESAVLVTDTALEEGERIVAYVEEVGRLEGTVKPLPEQGRYRLQLLLTPIGKDRLAQKLELLKNRSAALGIEKRRHERYRPRDSRSQIVLEDGRRYDCEIIDISISGASVRCPVLPAIGTPVMLGKTRGRVVRHHAEGFAIEFMRLLPVHSLQAKYRI